MNVIETKRLILRTWSDENADSLANHYFSFSNVLILGIAFCAATSPA